MAWHENLQNPRARDEAGFIVREFAEHNIDIGGVATEHGGVAFMYAEDHILAREQYLGGVEGIRGGPGVQAASRPRGVLDVLQDHGVVNVEVRRVVRDIVLLRLNPDRQKNRARKTLLKVTTSRLKVMAGILKVTTGPPEITAESLRVTAGPLKVSDPACSSFSSASRRNSVRESQRLITW